jgi:YVTN family beta-propeller protein
VIVFHELDVGGFASYPPAPLYDRGCEWITDLFRRSGNEGRMGIKLHQVFVNAGLPAPAMRMETIIGGDDTGMTQATGQSAVIEVGNGPLDLAVGGGLVWVTNSLDGTVSRIDPNTTEVGEVQVGSSPEGVAFGNGSVWVAVHTL